MGAGHGYSYVNYMLMDADIVYGIESIFDYLDTLENLSTKKQSQKMIENGSFGDEDDVTRFLRNLPVSSISTVKNDEEIESYDLDTMKARLTEFYSFHIDGLEDFEETIFEFAKTGLKNYHRLDDFDGDHQLRIIGESELSWATLEILLIADGYNSGIVAGIKSSQNERHVSNIDFKEILLDSVLMRDYFESIESKNSSIFKTKVEVLDFVQQVEEELSTEFKDIFMKGAEKEYEYILNLHDAESLYECDGITQENIDSCAEKIEKKVVANFQKEIDNLTNEYLTVVNTLFDHLIEVSLEGSFRYATTAWTSEVYNKDKKYSEMK